MNIENNEALQVNAVLKDNTKQSKSTTITCNHCQKQGHTWAECKSRLAGKPKTPRAQKPATNNSTPRPANKGNQKQYQPYNDNRYGNWNQQRWNEQRPVAYPQRPGTSNYQQKSGPSNYQQRSGPPSYQPRTGPTNYQGRPGPSNYQQQANTQRMNITCLRCRKPNHFAKDCKAPQMNYNNSGRGQNAQNSRQ